MPGVPRVGFVATPSVSRPPNTSEYNVIHNFALHASHCPRCADPLRLQAEGRPLCDRGRQHAERLVEYLYSQDRHVRSTVDFAGSHPVRVEINDANHRPVRDLLKALERGLRLHSRTPKARGPAVVSHDRTYPIASRPVVHASSRKDYHHHHHHQPRVEIVEPPMHASSQYWDYGHASYPRHSHHGGHRTTSRWPVHDDDIVVVAAPRASHRVSYHDRGFYR